MATQMQLEVILAWNRIATRVLWTVKKRKWAARQRSSRREKGRQRVRARDKKQRSHCLLEEQHEHFVAAVKVRNACGHQGENEQQWKKVNKNTYDSSFIKRVTRKFLEVLRCSLPKQRQRNVQKSVFKCKVAFLLIRPIFVFSPFSLPSPLSITQFYILFEQTKNIIEPSGAFSPG